MNLSTEQLGRWVDKFIDMGKLSFDEKNDFFDELIQYYADPTKEEYEKCHALKRMAEILEQWTVSRRIEDRNEFEKIALQTTEIIYYLVLSIQNEIDKRIDSLKSELTRNGK